MGNRTWFCIRKRPGGWANPAWSEALRAIVFLCILLCTWTSPIIYGFWSGSFWWANLNVIYFFTLWLGCVLGVLVTGIGLGD